MQLVFFCPPAHTINGGIKYIFRMAETLRAQGHDAVVLEEKERRPQWFANTAPIVGQSILQPNPNQIYILPEDQTQMLQPLKDWPQRKVIYSQNHFYSALVLGDRQDYAGYGVSHVIGSSRAIYDHARLRYPTVAAHIVPCAIDTVRFRPGAKHDRIAFMPRKRPAEASYIRDLFRALHPEYRGWQWQELSNLSENDVAKAMSEAKIFLSLSRLEGFGLTPLEAMAAGCVVAGFTGIGGQEYATAENGFWASEDDFPACVAQLKAAAALSNSKGPNRAAYDEAARKTIARYTPDIFEKAVKDVWAEILR